MAQRSHITQVITCLLLSLYLCPASNDTLAVKPYTKEYCWGFTKNGERAQDFYLVSVELDLGGAGSKPNLNKRKKTQCFQAGWNTYPLVAKLVIPKSDVAKQVLCKHGVWFYSLNFETHDQMSVVTEKVKAAVLCPLCVWAAQAAESSWSRGAVVGEPQPESPQEAAGNLLELSHAWLERPLQSLFIRASCLHLIERPTGKNN